MTTTVDGQNPLLTDFCPPAVDRISLGTNRKGAFAPRQNTKTKQNLPPASPSTNKTVGIRKNNNHNTKNNHTATTSEKSRKQPAHNPPLPPKSAVTAMSFPVSVDAPQAKATVAHGGLALQGAETTKNPAPPLGCEICSAQQRVNF